MATKSNDITGTDSQKPRWEGPPENRPRGYLPAKDDPVHDKDAAGESLSDPDRSSISDGAKTREGLNVEKDASGQFARSKHGGKNDGTVSANPRVISGDESGNATFSSGNERETGARKSFEVPDQPDRPLTETFDPDDEPPQPYGLTEPSEGRGRGSGHQDDPKPGRKDSTAGQ